MVIPVHDVNPTRRTPWVTYALIATNIIVFVLSPVARLGGSSLADLCQQEAFLDHYGAVPRELLHNMQLPLVPTGATAVGPQGAGCVIAPATYNKIPVLSVLYAMFLHGGWLHLLGNMLFLWVFGNNIEDRMGRLRFLAFYLLCGYVAVYGYALFNPNSTDPLVGASGAIAGVLGAYIVLYPRARVWSLVPFLLFIPLRLPAWIVLGFWFVLQWISSAGIAVSQASSVAYLAHVVGFAFGALVAWPLRRRGRRWGAPGQQQWPQQGFPSYGWAPTTEPQRPQWPGGWQQPGSEQRWPPSRWEHPTREGQAGWQLAGGEQTGWLSESTPQPESGELPPRGPVGP